MNKLWLVVLLTVCAAVPAHAATRGQMNRCNDATKELRGATGHTYKDQEVEGKDIKNAVAHLKQHVERFERAKKMLDLEGPWDPKDPDLAECVGLLESTRAYFEATKEKIKVAHAKLTRFASGHVVYRVGADPFCLQRIFNYVEPHLGGGKYQPAAGAGLLGGVVVVKCP